MCIGVRIMSGNLARCVYRGTHPEGMARHAPAGRKEMEIKLVYRLVSPESGRVGCGKVFASIVRRYLSHHLPGEPDPHMPLQAEEKCPNHICIAFPVL